MFFCNNFIKLFLYRPNERYFTGLLIQLVCVNNLSKLKLNLQKTFKNNFARHMLGGSIVAEEGSSGLGLGGGSHGPRGG
jgi:hypothetical protein